MSQEIPKIEPLFTQWIPKVYITLEAMAKVREYVSQCDVEIGWMGCVRKEQDEETGEITLTLYDAYAPSQEVSGATTDLDATGVAEYAMQTENPQDIRWWGHSHVNMGTSPSGTDMITFKEHVENLPRYDDYFVMSIHNKRFETTCHLYVGNGMYLKDVPIIIDYGVDVSAEVADEIKSNLRRKVMPKVTTGGAKNARLTKTNRSSTKRKAGAGKSTRTGSGSDRKSSGHDSSKNGNVERNLTRLRQN